MLTALSNEAPTSRHLISFVACAAGTFTDTTEISECTNAPAGSFVAAAGSSTFSACGIGTYTDTTGNTECFSCDQYNPDSINRPFYFGDEEGASVCKPCACNGNRGTDECDLTDGTCKCKAFYVGSKNGLPDGVDVDCKERQDILLSIILAYIFFAVFILVCVPLLFHSGFLASLSFSMRRDIGILAARMRLRTESAIRTLARKQRNEITKKLNQDLYRSFVSLDFDNSGSIDIDELRALVDILQLDYTEENLQKALNLVDADGNGTLDFEEFRHIISVFAHREARKRIIIARREAFSRVCTRLVDIDHARSLCASLVKGVTLDDVKNGSMGSHIDFDGEIPFVEFN